LSSVLEATIEVATPPDAARSRAAVARSLIRNPLALTGAILLACILVATIFASVIAPYNPDAINLLAAHTAPSATHLLGTDLQGRDVLSRLLFAGRASLEVGAGAVLVTLVVGIPLGIVAGYLGGWADSVIMRLTDIMLSFPIIMLTILAAAILGDGVWQLVLVLGLISWPTVARLVRGVAIAQREMDHVLSARALGATSHRIILRHILPSTAGVVVVNATFGVAQMVLIEASLSFLGLGIQPPTASWGNMLTDAQQLSVLESNPWMWAPPIVVIAVTIISINFLGDGLQKALDPRSRSRR
jgi:peptide/nickel transport system permease protein